MNMASAREACSRTSAPSVVVYSILEVITLIFLAKQELQDLLANYEAALLTFSPFRHFSFYGLKKLWGAIFAPV